MCAYMSVYLYTQRKTEFNSYFLILSFITHFFFQLLSNVKTCFMVDMENLLDWKNKLVQLKHIEKFKWQR